ncbi:MULTISPECIES: hypothetical protein [Nocardia]|uniref:hypothetical protein n=1 Tax=Nocardia TaxID=1817 RepID=UPI000BF1364A|nr:MULTISPECIES: hypothetical protein [Nocardia]MBF6293047.1 hypothetical protein [Nocardia farcinica]MBF6309946.1 hypothetical protein [Nocardia farcinica]MBF6379342.1 hypothetical protein [Nocardia farcinica]MBF6406232.1 hypothetical protein [Nocardia farcinica]PEH75810.1 hypothetical protein CRM89_07245 [Nocardia sp. FDAARGOS_372]
MKCATRMAAGVGVGYILGRTRKMRLALMLVGAGLSRQGSRQELIERGTSLINSSPELSRLAESLRGELLGAARTAAVSVASNRIDALNARLQQHGSHDEQPGGTDAEERAEPDESDEYPAAETAAAGESDETESDDSERDQDAADQTGDEGASVGRPVTRRRSAAPAARRRAARSRSEGEPDDEPSPRRRRTGVRAGTSDRAPVRRTSR